MPQTREHVLLAKRVGVEHLVVAVNKADGADPELTDLVELELQELLAEHGYDGVPMVRVSGLRALEGDPVWIASIEALLQAVDEHIPVPVRYVDAPFLMPVENVLTVTGRGTVVTGAIERGAVRVGDTVEAVGFGDAFGAVVTGVETFGKTMERGEAGDNAAVLLRGVRREQVRRGMVLAAPGSQRAHRSFTARVYFLTAEEGGRRKPIASGYRPQFYLRTTDVPGELTLDGPTVVARPGDGPTVAAQPGDGPTVVARPGDTVEVAVELGKAVALEPGLGFAIREGGLTVGAGTILTVPDA
jgi:elongation factor Tu